MDRKHITMHLLILLAAAAVVGCGTNKSIADNISGSAQKREQEQLQRQKNAERMGTTQEEKSEKDIREVTLTSKITQLEENFMAVQYDADYGFQDFLNQGGASSDGEVIKFLTDNILSGSGLGFFGRFFGCSTLKAFDAQGNTLFGRNFDWQNCEAMVVVSKPQNGDYASISTVNMDFIRQGAGGVPGMALKLETVRTIAALYAPLDGMNEKGLGISVNMIEDSERIEQTTEKPDITTTTAIRLLLNRAADVEEALALLEAYDMHASMGMMVHFALTDAAGRSVVVEYIDHEMVVTDTPVVTNFYLAEGEKQGIGSVQSHERYELLLETLSKSDTMSMESMRDALDSVSKDNFNDFASTEWSIVFNLSGKEAVYYHRENYEKGYLFQLQ